MNRDLCDLQLMGLSSMGQPTWCPEWSKQLVDVPRAGYSWASSGCGSGCMARSRLGVKWRKGLQDFGVEQGIMKKERVGINTMNPVHRQVMDAEQVMVAKMRRELRVSCGLAWDQLCETRVDSCLFQTGKRAMTKTLEHMRKLTYADLHKPMAAPKATMRKHANCKPLTLRLLASWAPK